jgi:hypothetical protein
MKPIYKSEWCEIETVVYERKEDPDAHFAAKLMISRRNAKKIRRIYQKEDKESCNTGEDSVTLS